MTNISWMAVSSCRLPMNTPPITPIGWISRGSRPSFWSWHLFAKNWRAGGFKMKILVTGAMGFIGRNLLAELTNQGYTGVYEYDLETDPACLAEYAKDCAFVFHLAGVNRPQNVEDFMTGNFGFTTELLHALKKNNNTCPV